jgi:hypothetical protein
MAKETCAVAVSCVCVEGWGGVGGGVGGQNLCAQLCVILGPAFAQRIEFHGVRRR